MSNLRHPIEEETRGLIVFPLPDEEYEYLCSLHGPYFVLVVAQLIEWTKELEEKDLHGATSGEIRDKINELLDENFLGDIVRRLYFNNLK
jgi:hypothetical protein|tara:strand:- start:506 stop:775 length:270 start_codon:yes stop_codon:yes gene_type:complete